jgi:redox-sensitive bicupin YhaK (pirin superfamily)
MSATTSTVERAAVLIQSADTRPMMGIDVLEPVPAWNIPYELSDPYILVHEATVPINPERAQLDTTHAHRGFDNLWYILSGEASTGHSTGPDGDFERARLDKGGLLKIRTGRGVYHAESIGADQLREGRNAEFRSVLFWVNLARKDKDVEPTAQVVTSSELRSEVVGDALVRTLVGPGSPVDLGTPALILDVEFPGAGSLSLAVDPTFNAFIWMLEGELALGSNGPRARRGQIAVLGPGENLMATDATPGTRFLLMSGRPYGEMPIYNGPFVD